MIMERCCSRVVFPGIFAHALDTIAGPHQALLDCPVPELRPQRTR